MKILIMKFRNIGDTLLASPLANNLKAHFKDAQIHFACNEGCEDMLSLNPNIDKIHIYRRKALKSKGIFGRIFGEIKFALSLRKEGFDIAINTTEGDRGIYLALFSGAKKRLSFEGGALLSRLITDIIPPNSNAHTIERDLGALSVLGLEAKSKAVKIYFDKKDEEIFADLPQSFIHIHPMSRWLFKCPKDELIANIIDYCQGELGIPCVLTCANDSKEKERCENIIKLSNHKPRAFLGTLSLKQVAALSSKAALFFGVDTAIMHMAAAVDTPVLAIFGPSSARAWGPWDNALNKSYYTAKSGIQNMGKHSIIQANWPCVPCQIDGCDGSKISRCLTELDAQIIKNLIKRKLEK